MTPSKHKGTVYPDVSVLRHLVCWSQFPDRISQQHVLNFLRSAASQVASLRAKLDVVFGKTRMLGDKRKQVSASLTMAHKPKEQTRGQISSSQIQLQVLKDELHAANKKVDRYAHLIASLSEELDNLRRSICHDCKKKFLPSYAASSSDGAPIVSDHPTQTPSSGLPSNLSTGNPESLNASTPIRSSTTQRNKSDPAILAPHQASSSGIPIPTHPSTSPDDKKIHRHRTVSGQPTQASDLPPVLPKNTGVSPAPNVSITTVQNKTNPTISPPPKASSSALAIPTHPSTTPYDKKIHRHRAVSCQPTQTSDRPLVLPKNTGVSPAPNVSIPIISITVQQNQSNPTILPPLQASSSPLAIPTHQSTTLGDKEIHRRHTVSGQPTKTPDLPPVLPTNTAVSLAPNVSITTVQNQTDPTILPPPKASASSALAIPTHPLTTSSDKKIHPHRTVSGQPTQTSDLPPVLPRNIVVSPAPNVSIPIISITVQQNQTNPMLPPQASSSALAIPTYPSTTTDDKTKPKPAGWSVSHNPNIKQSLKIYVVKTFNFTAGVFCVKFSPNGKYLAVGTDIGSGKTFIYDVEKGLQICCLVDQYLKSQPIVWCIQFSPDNKYIATASDKIRIWEIARKRTRAEFTHSAPKSLCFSPDGRFIVAGERCHVRIWSLRDGSSKTLLDSASATFSITFSPDGRHIASVDFDGWLRIWEVRTGRLLDTWTGHPWKGLCLAFSPDGKGLVSGGGDRILRYWDVSSLSDMEMSRDRVIGGAPGHRFQQIRKFEGHKALVRAVSFSLDNRWVATSSPDDSVRIWDPHTAEWQCMLHGDAYARAVDFNPARRYMASGGLDKQVRVWRYREV